MNIFRVKKYFDRTIFFVCAENEQKALEYVDDIFLKQLNDIKDDNGQYDDFRRNESLRFDELEVELVLENVVDGSIKEVDFSEFNVKFFYDL